MTNSFRMCIVLISLNWIFSFCISAWYGILRLVQKQELMCNRLNFRTFPVQGNTHGYCLMLASRHASLLVDIQYINTLWYTVSYSLHASVLRKSVSFITFAPKIGTSWLLNLDHYFFLYSGKCPGFNWYKSNDATICAMGPVLCT